MRSRAPGRRRPSRHFAPRHRARKIPPRGSHTRNRSTRSSMNPLPIAKSVACKDLSGLGLTFEMRPSIAEMNGCIVAEPVSVSTFGGENAITLTQPALVNCRLARQVRMSSALVHCSADICVPTHLTHTCALSRGVVAICPASSLRTGKARIGAKFSSLSEGAA